MLKPYVDLMVEILDRDPAPRAPANLENNFTARALDAREDYWCTETISQNTTPATDDIYQNHTLTIDRPLDAYL
jgi:hypothetical protein